MSNPYTGTNTTALGNSWFPYLDNNTYIRPGLANPLLNGGNAGSAISIGDMGTSTINIGMTGSTTTMNGTTNHMGPVTAGSLQAANITTMSDWLRIYGSSNAGTAVYNGMTIGDGGGLNVGSWVPKPPAGQFSVNNSAVGVNPPSLVTYFNYQGNTGSNYIRGTNTQIDTPVTINNTLFINKICGITNPSHCINLNDANGGVAAISLVNAKGEKMAFQDDNNFVRYNSGGARDGWSVT